MKINDLMVVISERITAVFLIAITITSALCTIIIWPSKVAVYDIAISFSPDRRARLYLSDFKNNLYECECRGFLCSWPKSRPEDLIPSDIKENNYLVEYLKSKPQKYQNLQPSAIEEKIKNMYRIERLSDVKRYYNNNYLMRINVVHDHNDLLDINVYDLENYLRRQIIQEISADFEKMHECLFERDNKELQKKIKVLDQILVFHKKDFNPEILFDQDINNFLKLFILSERLAPSRVDQIKEDLASNTLSVPEALDVNVLESVGVDVHEKPDVWPLSLSFWSQAFLGGATGLVLGLVVVLAFVPSRSKLKRL